MVAKGISNTAFGGAGLPGPACPGRAGPAGQPAGPVAAVLSCYDRTELDVTDSESPPE